MTTINVSSGQIVPFIAYQFNTFGAPSGSYTFTFNTTGFNGAINLYQNFFDPTQPGANFYVNGVVANAPGTITLTAHLIAGSLWEVVFSGVATGSAGTYSASVSGPGNVNLSPVANTRIVTGPGSPTIAAGGSANLSVYGLGPLPHKWQWYGGPRGNTTRPIAGATSASYNTGPLLSSTSYWVLVSGPGNSGSVTSSTANVTVTGNPGAGYSGTLSPGGCVLQNGNLFSVQRFQIQQGGNYAFTITPGFTLTTYANFFDSQNPIANLWGVLNGAYAPGIYELVISKASPGGAFSGAIGGGPAIVTLLTSLPPSILSSPLDTTILSGQSTTLGVSTTCGTPFTLQWFRGQSGDTSNPIPGATGFSYTTPTLTSTTPYWVRMVGGGTTNSSQTATVFIGTHPVRQTGALSPCDRVFNRPATTSTTSGLNCFYKLFVFRPSQSGVYTFTLNTTGFAGRMHLYSGVFVPDNPVVNLNAVSGNELTSTITANGNLQYLVISGTNPGDQGGYDVRVTVAPALVTLYPAPVITSQTIVTNIYSGQTAALSVTSPNNGVSFQWYQGASCLTKTAISGANASTYTTPALTDYAQYWVELTSQGGYLFSSAMNVGIIPVAVGDVGSTSEDTTLAITAPGLLANDLKAPGRSLAASLQQKTLHGIISVFANGAYQYVPDANYFGPDSFTYLVSDSTLVSTQATVRLNVTPVADKPSVTSASTSMGQQTTNGLVINRNPVDGLEVTHFRIVGITNGQLFLNNGTTPISPGSFITFAQGNAGLRFTPSPGLFSPSTSFGFAVQASTSSTVGGLGGEPAAGVINVSSGLAIQTQPVSVALCNGNTASFSVTVNSPGVTYQWQRRASNSALFVEIPGATSDRYTTPGLAPIHDGTAYRVIVRSATTNVVSAEALVSLISIPTAGTVSYDFNGGAPTNVALYGSASVVNGVLELNPGLPDQYGSMLTTDLASGRLVRGFAARFKMRIQTTSSPPADGFSFNWADDLPNDVFIGGEEGEGSGLSICFDTYANSEGEAPAIDVKWGGILVARYATTIDVLPGPPDFADVAIRLNPDGTLDVTYRCRSIFARLPVPGYRPMMNARFGIGSRTGGLHETHGLDNLTLQMIVDPTNGVPRFTGVSKLPPAGLNFTGVNPAGQNVSIESSANLIDWVWRATVRADGGGAWQFVEADISSVGHRFFRARAAAHLPSGLVNWWSADGNHRDSFGGLNGTPLNTAGFATGQRGAAFDFNGVGQVIELGGSPLPLPWTACFWVKRHDAIDASAALLADGATALKLEQWPSSRQLGITQFGVADHYFNTILPTNVWTHLSLVADAGGTTVYSNGVPSETHAATVALPRAMMGARPTPVINDRMRGLLDETIIFDRALTSNEIRQVINVTRGP